MSPRVATAMAIGLMLVLAVALQPAQAQTCNVLHNFTGGQDGANPYAGVTLDKAGNIYGTTSAGGKGYGTVFKLKPTKSGYVFNPLYTFSGASDGSTPEYGVVFGPDGSLYGATTYGGDINCDQESGCGVVFNLKPPMTACKTALCPWVETVIHTFAGSSDGSYPEGSTNLVFDQAGNIYGTTAMGGTNSFGTLYELTRSGGNWTKTVVHNFNSVQNDGAMPAHNIVFDKAGNMYGTTEYGGANNGGTVFQMAPSGSGWVESIVADFMDYGSAGGEPEAGLIVDPSNNVYGATSTGGSGWGGTVFQLTLGTLNVLYSFSGGYTGPYGNLVMDNAGNLYGTTYGDPNGLGSIFKLTLSGGVWTFTDLYDFPNCTCGCDPLGDLTIDANGNLYGTAWRGGAYGDGVVFEFTP